MKDTTKNKDTFTQVSDRLAESHQLSGDAKLLISFILRWQRYGKKCTMSNQALADKIGLSVSTFKRLNGQLNKLCFYESEFTPYRNEFGSYVNAKITRVDENRLNEYLKAEVDEREAEKQAARNLQGQPTFENIQTTIESSDVPACLPMSQDTVEDELKREEEELFDDSEGIFSRINSIAMIINDDGHLKESVISQAIEIVLPWDKTLGYKPTYQTIFGVLVIYIVKKVASVEEAT